VEGLVRVEISDYSFRMLPDRILEYVSNRFLINRLELSSVLDNWKKLLWACANANGRCASQLPRQLRESFCLVVTAGSGPGVSPLMLETAGPMAERLADPFGADRQTRAVASWRKILFAGA
jgi:hypothetical protein